MTYFWLTMLCTILGFTFGTVLGYLMANLEEKENEHN